MDRLTIRKGGYDIVRTISYIINMIYTITFNPGLDYVIDMPHLKLGTINRSKGENIYFGGKGINVSVVLKELGLRSYALGFIAGFIGDAIEQGVRDMGINTDFVRLDSGNSRINVKVRSSEETELNGKGPDISADALEKFYAKLDRIQDGDTAILAGSVPGSLPSDVYEQILIKISDRNVRAVVDAEKGLLLNVLKYHPWLVKPNNHELEDIFGVKLENTDQIVHCAEKLRDMGAQNVLVSMAGDGAVLIGEDGIVRKCKACTGTLKNSVGAGDSMLAGFVAGAYDGDLDHALKLGSACGGATAFSDGLANRSLIDELLKQF